VAHLAILRVGDPDGGARSSGHRLAAGADQGHLAIESLGLHAEIGGRHVGGAVRQDAKARQPGEGIALGELGLDGMNGAVAGADEDRVDAFACKLAQDRREAR
jgi:hypothetical protein